MENKSYYKLRRKYILTIVAIITLVITAILFDINSPSLITKDCKRHLDSIEAKNSCWEIITNTSKVSNLFNSKVNYEIVFVDFTGCKGQYGFNEILNNQTLVDKEAQIIFNGLVNKNAFRELELRFHSNSNHNNSEIFTYIIKGETIEFKEKSTLSPAL